ncbi:acyclic terpene utilization AtuA family protein [Bradyrhizobium sp.]|uniref:acyclic terpene utilization AtuA family protein n=1 Tax=Bradyrhizobium sp. TaxID=376 RepID=UPI0039E47D55
MKKVRIGCGSSWSRDRLQPAKELVLNGQLDYICFDAMSEVTMSIAQVARANDTRIPPYDPYLDARMRPILKECVERGVRIITSAGWIDPVAAADKLVEIGKELGIPKLKVAAVSGSVITDRILDLDVDFLEDGKPVKEFRDSIISAEVYMGAEGIVKAIASGADVIVTSRIGDGCPYLAALVHELGWSMDDHHAVAKGMIIGHLMECGSQITGGCFADPGYKDVPNIADLGNPIVEVTDDKIVISILPDKGGIVSQATCQEQLLYEVQDPSTYICPDVIADLTKVRFREIGVNEVEVLIDGAGRPRTPTLKALIGLREGFVAEEMVLFAGPGALQRAEMTKDILEQRLKMAGLDAEEIRWDFVGLNAVHRESTPNMKFEPNEIVLRVAVKTKTRDDALKLGLEVDPLAVTGVYGIGKWGTHSPGTRVRPVVGLNSALVARSEISPKVTMR